ncbi:MAG: nucleotidyltransferase family protein [Lascolabacillus sp.]|jgi:predicted nucleotidyltransferase|nr:nucleotidyltransferase family protein [Lascolabacillus sp.]
MAKEQNTNLNNLIIQLRENFPRLQREYAVRSLGLFGSYVRGEQKKSSDLDILVDFVEVPGMFRFLDLERELARLLGIRVDLVQKDALKPAIGKRILHEVLEV